MANTTFSGPVRSENGFETVSINATTGAVTTTSTLGANTTVTSITVDTLEFTGAATAASNAAAFTADFILEISADGTTYYVPAAAAVW